MIWQEIRVPEDPIAQGEKVGNLDAKVSELAEKIDRNQAQIVELLTQLIGRDPNAG
ncbi:hypothetical protein [Streptomyces acidicola]|uniref:hypothetical protein n=1 Tax=Streptomyces acidicola TaxID=2596892 RepID=UPI0037F5023D